MDKALNETQNQPQWTDEALNQIKSMSKENQCKSLFCEIIKDEELIWKQDPHTGEAKANKTPCKPVLEFVMGFD